MKILHVITDMRMGGAERALARLALSTREWGHSVEVVALKELGEAAEPLREAGIPCHALHAPERPGPALVTTTIALGALIRRVRPDVVHAWLASACAAVHLSAPSTIPCIYGVRVTDLPPPAVTTLLRASRGVRITWVAVSNACRDAWAPALGLSTMTVIPNGVDVEGDPVGEPENARPVFIGRLAHQKGLDVLIEALVETDLSVDVYGSGELDEKLRVEAEDHGVAMRFHGLTRDTRSVLDRASMLVLPSRSEGMPNVVLEAMAAGRAVVATRIPGTDEVVVDGKTGILVPPEDPDALRDAVLALQGDPVRRRKMGEAGFKRVVKHFAHRRNVEDWMALYARA